MKTEITLAIDCEEKSCGSCQFKTIFQTGLVGEFHPKCELFDGHYGQWGKRDMKRCRKCVAAQKKAARSNARLTGPQRPEQEHANGTE